MNSLGAALSMFGKWCEQTTGRETIGFSLTVHPSYWLLPRFAALSGMNGRPLTVYHSDRVGRGVILVAAETREGRGRDVAFGEDRLRAMMKGPQ